MSHFTGLLPRNCVQLNSSSYAHVMHSIMTHIEVAAHTTIQEKVFTNP